MSGTACSPSRRSGEKNKTLRANVFSLSCAHRKEHSLRSRAVSGLFSRVRTWTWKRRQRPQRTTSCQPKLRRLYRQLMLGVFFGFPYIWVSWPRHSSSLCHLVPSHSLSATRKKRKPAPGYAIPDNVRSYTQTTSIPSLHATKPAGISALDLSSDGSVALTGGPDKTVQVFDLSDKKTVATLKGHTKPVNQVAFVEDNLAVSSSADKTVKVWSSSDSAWTLAHNFTGPKAEVVGFSVHPSKKLVASASADSTWSLHDLATYTTVKTYSPIEGDGGDFAYTSFTGHPDGILHAGGTKSGSIRVWDVRDASSLAGTLDGYAAQPVNSMSFSENGYYLATSTSSEPTVKVFDLRKLALLSSWSLPAENKVSEVRFDASAQFLTVAGTDLRVYANKTWEELLKFEENAGDLTAARWTPGGKEIVVSGMDRCLRVLGSAS